MCVCVCLSVYVRLCVSVCACVCVCVCVCVPHHLKWLLECYLDILLNGKFLVDTFVAITRQFVWVRRQIGGGDRRKYGEPFNPQHWVLVTICIDRMEPVVFSENVQ